jgi:hypothetical protein
MSSGWKDGRVSHIFFNSHRNSPRIHFLLLLFAESSFTAFFELVAMG